MDEDGYYIVSCPVFTGCLPETIDEPLENIKETIEICFKETKVGEQISLENLVVIQRT